jgi:phosphatidylserine/phosphatidylglycerophosphate/cardiolipin synthase-like enzyme
MSASRAAPSIADVGTASLRRLAEGLESNSLRAPVSRAALIAFGVSEQLDILAAVLSGHSRPACITILRSVLAERARHDRPGPELVWTGPEGDRAQARDTAVVLRDLFEKARRRVVLAGYSFKNAESVLRPLERVMVEHGVEAHFFVNIDQPDHAPANPEAYGQEQLSRFVEANWPFSTPPPALYCDRRALTPGHGGTYCSLHAKCVAVDSERAFISSANFTLRAHDRNIETGVLVTGRHFAMLLDRQWMSLVPEHVLQWRRT